MPKRKPEPSEVQRIADRLRREILRLTPDHVRATVEQFVEHIADADRTMELWNSLVTDEATRDMEAIIAAVHGVTAATRVYHCDPESELGALVMAAEKLGVLRALVQPRSRLVAAMRREAHAQTSAKGGRTRAARYAAIAEEVRRLYAEWQAGRFTVPTSRKGRRLVRDFDAWAAEKFDVNPEKIEEYRLQKGGQ